MRSVNIFLGMYSNRGYKFASCKLMFCVSWTGWCGRSKFVDALTPYQITSDITVTPNVRHCVSNSLQNDHNRDHDGVPSQWASYGGRVCMMSPWGVNRQNVVGNFGRFPCVVVIHPDCITEVADMGYLAPTDETCFMFASARCPFGQIGLWL